MSFELFTNELQKMYGDKDRPLNPATKDMREYQQLPNESVRGYANCLNNNWRRAGRSMVMDEVVVNDMGLVGLRHALKTKVGPWISSGNDRFNTLDRLFDCAAASQFKLDHKQPGGQQPQRQAGENRIGGDTKHNFRPSISEPAENTSGNSYNSGTSNSKSVKSNKLSGGSRANNIQRHGFQSKSTKVERQTGNSLAAAAETTIP